MAPERKCRIGVLVLVLFLMLGFYNGGGRSAVQSGPAAAPSWFVPCFKLPVKADFCGEAVPFGSCDVDERFDREFTIVSQSHAQVDLWLKRKDRYFPWVEGVLSRMGLPSDLKYVAVAESDLMAHVVSPAGAAGPWQLMPDTSVRFGITRSAAVDERYDFEKSATAAFQYLKRLHDLFHNWTLATAAYNCGETRLQTAIEKDKSDSYYSLVLPRETERYVFRIMAIKEVLENPDKYGYYLPKGSGYAPLLFDSVRVTLPGPMPIAVAAEATGTTYRDIKVLNPELISDVVPAGDSTVRVPAGRGKQFEKGVAAWKAARKPLVEVHQVLRGETLDSIARRYNATKVQVCNWNHIAGNRVKIGQKLKILR